MSPTVQAVLFALGTAVSAASFSLIVRRGQKHGSATTGVLIGLIVSVPLLLMASAFAWERTWWHPTAFFYFTLAGLTGPALGRIGMYLSIHHMGVTRAMPMMALNPLLTSGLAYTFLGERPGPYIWAGTLLITAGCAALTFKRGGETGWSRRHLWMPVLAVTAFSVSNILRKVGMNLLPSPLFGITMTSLTGLIFFFFFIPVFPRSYKPELRLGKVWIFYGACGLLNTFAFFLHFHALHRGDLTVVSPLSSTAPFFSLVLSAFLLKDVEEVTPRIVLGTLCSVTGGVLITWRIF